MTLAEIYSEFAPGSPGFVRAVQKYCGAQFGCSNAEIERLGRACKTAAEFENDWSGDVYWTDYLADFAAARAAR
jgi:hypothetical protein